jgi:mono/diheme cytochrome c family protein
MAGTRSEPLGTTKAGVSSDLDALAAYVASLSEFDQTPHRNGSGSLTAAAKTGKNVFEARNCASCHGGNGFTNSGANTLSDVGTLKPTSGSRLGQPLTGIDIPTLRDVWATAPYLHDGSAATLADAVRAHSNVTITDADLANLVEYLRQIGSEEPGAPAPPPPPATNGLLGTYYNNLEMSGQPVLTRIENVNFTWDDSPAPGVNPDNFSIRWTGQIEPTVTGSYYLQTKANDRIRLWLNGTQLIDRWGANGTYTDTTAAVQLVAGTRYAIVVEYADVKTKAIAKLSWQPPGASGFSVVPLNRLFVGN